MSSGELAKKLDVCGDKGWNAFSDNKMFTLRWMRPFSILLLWSLMRILLISELSTASASRWFKNDFVANRISSSDLMTLWKVTPYDARNLQQLFRVEKM